jgi:Ca2+-binding EF-hand superfamily protein
MKPLHTCSLVFALLANASLALAQTSPAPLAPPKAMGDRHEHMRARWQQADLDKDGQLSKAEAQAAGMRHLTENFEAIDANKDGKISEAEVMTWMKARHSARGAKGAPPPTGQAGTAPFGKAPPPLPAGAAGNTSPPPHHDGGMGYKTPEQRQAAMKERFAKADTNKDGALSKAEAQAAGMHRIVDNFDAIDTNKDGKITPEELRAAWERRK